MKTLAEDRCERGTIDLDEAFIDGSFGPAIKGATESAKPGGQGNKDHGNQDAEWPKAEATP